MCLSYNTKVYKKQFTFHSPARKRPVPEREPAIGCGIITDYLTFIQDYIKVVEFVEWLDLVRFPVP